MSILEVLAVIAGWSGVIFVGASLWSAFGARRPRNASAPLVRAGYLTQLGPPECNCGICTGSVRLPLSPQDVANVQASVLAVVGGVTRVVAGAADYMTTSGVGRVALIVCDDSMFTQVLEPAIQRHLAATRLGT